MLVGPDAAVLTARRGRLMDAMRGGVMLLAAAPERPRTADQLYPFRQDSDFGYVTSFPEPEAVCVLRPGHAAPFVLFVQPHDQERAIWVGPRFGVAGATATFGADLAYPLDELEVELAAIVLDAPHVYVQLGRNDALAERLLRVVRKVQAERPRSGKGPVALFEAAEVLHEARLHKAPEEIVALQSAIDIAGEAHRAAMRTARPGMYEYEIEALLNYTFRRQGADGPAYDSIVASGPGATILHYTRNDRVLGPDELLLIDAGCERAGYCADITRTFPTGRRYLGAHRDLYDAVLAANLAAVNAARPGTTIEALHALALRVLCDAAIHLGLLAGTVDEVIERESYRRYYMHRTSHWLGRDVHDVGNYKLDGQPRPLAPGMVFTIEPGLYVAPDDDQAPPAFRGIGIRIEDDVLVTADGVQVLTAAVPKHAIEVEALRDEAFAAA